VVRAQFRLHNSVCQLEVGLALLVSLQDIHAAAQIVVHSRSVHCVAAQTLFSDLARFQVAAEGPRWLIYVVHDAAEATVCKSLIRVVHSQFDSQGLHVAADSDVVLSAAFVNTAERQFKVEFLLGSQIRDSLRRRSILCDLFLSR
jgi:hypothetical protein